ncbi:MAG: hypothetical protein ACLFP2_02805 [Candidatus Woesearchaeota archaeon]
MKIPKVPKKVSAYLLGEDGKISKQSIMALGSFLGSAAIGSILADSVEAKPKACSGKNDGYNTNAKNWCYGGSTSIPVGETKYCHENSLSDFEYDDSTYQVKVTHSHDVQHCSY